MNRIAMKEKAPADPSPTRGIKQTKTRRTTFLQVVV